MGYRSLAEYAGLLRGNGVLAEAKLCGKGDEPVRNISYNSKEDLGSALFICKGIHFSEKYLEEAMNKGALAYVSEKAYGCGSDTPNSGSASRPRLIVSDIRKAMAIIANSYHEENWRNLKLAGVTGTKGKSTVTYYMKSILDDWMRGTGGEATAILSGIDNYDGVINEESHLTTPETFELYRHFAHAVSKNIRYLSMEVSSQALKYQRTLGILFDVACFLNIGEDHISDIEHSDYEDYFASKLKFFSQCKRACVNLGTQDAERVLEAAKAAPELVAFGLTEQADVMAYDIRPEDFGIKFMVRAREACGHNFDEAFEISMTGLFNVENALAAISMALCLDVPLAYVKSGLFRAKAPGRMEIFKGGGKTAIVDYAHNQLSFETLFKSVRQEYPGKKICIVFGCPGKKALGRRRELGTLAGEYADRIILTEEDAGEESASDICREIEAYVGNGKDCVTILDRAEAIKAALDGAGTDWVTLITGKGRETRQKRGLEYVETPSDVDYVQLLMGQ